MKNSLILIGLIMLLVAGCGKVATVTPTPTPTPPAPTPVYFNTKIIVSVPYWTTGDVYLGQGTNEALLKLDKINEVTYTKAATLEVGATYYFTHFSVPARSTNTFTAESYDITYQAVYDWADSTKIISKPNFIKGVTFAASQWDDTIPPLIDPNLPRLDEFNVEWAAIVPNWFAFGSATVPTLESTDIRPYYIADPDPSGTSYTIPTSEIVSLIRKLKAAGKKIMLKPHVDPIDYGITPGSWRGVMQPAANKWDEWFAAYQNFILHYADIAQAEGVELLCIGCELDKVTFTTASGITADATARWRNMITAIRGRYSGKLTYSPGGNNDGSGPALIGFWDKLDYIGFENYFPLTTLDDPTVADLLSSLNNVLNTYIKPLYDAYGKPVLMTEINCNSFHGVTKGGPIEPPPAGAVVDHQEQANVYEAFYQAMENKSWIEGIFWWAWYLDGTVPGYYLVDNMSDAFVRKTAGQVMRKWYGKIID